MDVRSQGSKKSFYQNKYLQYRALVESTKDFSSKLSSAESSPSKSSPAPASQTDKSASQKSDLDKPTEKVLAEKSKGKSHKVKIKGYGATTAAAEPTKIVQTEKPRVAAAAPEPVETPNTRNISEAPLNVRVPNLGSASDRMMDKVREYEPMIRAAAHRYNLPPELIAGVIWQESRGNPRATSHCGAMGLMQLMPATAASLGVSNPYDAGQCIDGGSKYLRQMLDKFGRVDHAVAAYNAGPGNVAKFGGIPPFAETQGYVPCVLGFANGFRTAGAFQQMTTATAVRV